MSHSNVNSFLDGFIPKESILLRSILNEAGSASLESKHIFDIKAISSRILGFAAIPTAAASVVGYSLSGVGKLFRVIDGNPLQALKEALNDEFSALKSLALTVGSVFYAIFGLFGDHYVYASCMTTDKTVESTDIVEELKDIPPVVKDYEATIKELTSELETLKSTHNQNLATLEKDQEDIKDLKNQLEQSLAARALLASKNKEIESEKQTLESKIKQLSLIESEKQTLESKIRQLSLELEQYQQFPSTSPLIESKISRLTGEVKQLQQNLKEADHALAESRKEYKNLEKKIVKSEGEQENLKEKYNLLVTKYKKAVTDKMSLESEQENQAKGIKDLEKKLKELKALQLGASEKDELKQLRQYHNQATDANYENLLKLASYEKVLDDLNARHEEIKLLVMDGNKKITIINQICLDKADINKKISKLKLKINMFKKREKILQDKKAKPTFAGRAASFILNYTVYPVAKGSYNLFKSKVLSPIAKGTYEFVKSKIFGKNASPAGSPTHGGSSLGTLSTTIHGTLPIIEEEDDIDANVTGQTADPTDPDFSSTDSEATASTTSGIVGKFASLAYNYAIYPIASSGYGLTKSAVLSAANAISSKVFGNATPAASSTATNGSNVGANNDSSTNSSTQPTSNSPVIEDAPISSPTLTTRERIIGAVRQAEAARNWTTAAIGGSITWFKNNVASANLARAAMVGGIIFTYHLTQKLGEEEIY